MSILLASIQITIPRAHRRRLSSVLKTPLRRRRSPGYFSYQTNGLPHLTHGARTHIVATQQKTTQKKRPAKKSKPAENATMGPPCREIVLNCQKTPQGGLFLGPLWRAVQHCDRKTAGRKYLQRRIAHSARTACQEGGPLVAFPGRNDPTRRNARFEREVDNQFTKPQTARASFHPPDRNQSRPAHQIASGTSYVSAHPSPKHLDRKAAPAQPAFRTPVISRPAHQIASGTPTTHSPSR